MHTGNRRVWDFAGDGWVHRLVIQRPDPDPDSILYPDRAPLGYSVHDDDVSGINSSGIDTGGGGSGLKLVEVSDPRAQSSQRSQLPPLSSEQEEEIVNRYDTISEGWREEYDELEVAVFHLT